MKLTWLHLLCLLIACFFLTQPALAEVKILADKKISFPELAIEKTDHPDDFRTEIYGDEIIVTTDPIAAGKITLELELAETYHKTAGLRAMSVFHGDALLAPRIDIFEEAGGFAKPITKTYTLNHTGGPVVIRLVAIEDKAKFNILRLGDASGNVLVSLSAKDAPFKPNTGTPHEVFRVLKPDEMVFFNADHAPFGAYDSLVYGNRGVQNRWGGFAHATGDVPKTGVTIGTLDETGLHRLPFTPGTLSEIDPSKITRTLRACTDTWTTPTFSFTHYTPAWPLADWDLSTTDERKRFLLPATWIDFDIRNPSKTSPLTFVFGLPVEGKKTDFFNGKMQGFAFGNRSYLAVAKGTATLIESSAAPLAPSLHGSLFTVTLEPGQSRSLRVFVASYDTHVTTGPIKAKCYYTSLFSSIDDVLDSASQLAAQNKKQCEVMDKRLQQCGQNVYRQFLSAHALHSYLYNTEMLIDADQQPLFAELEGEYAFINTFDLTIDHAFYQLAMHPWTLRNILDRFANQYTYRSNVTDRAGQSHEGGRSFTHDMGRGMAFSPLGTSDYESRLPLMSAEELQNWILCAGLYYKKTTDLQFLQSHEQTLREAMDSLIHRDAATEKDRRGIIGLVSGKGDGSSEITTYDALDHSLKSARDSGYLAVKCWACYIALESLFKDLGDADRAQQARTQADLAAKTIVSQYEPKARTFPAVFDGKNTSRTIPMIEALVYPQQMGLKDAVSLQGPYKEMLAALRDHTQTILTSGTCLDATTGGWKLSSTSNNTWQSKVYLNQYVAEQILQLKSDRTEGNIDAIHASFQVLGCPELAWCDQLQSTTGRALGSTHYPRGVTSALWWLVKE